MMPGIHPQAVAAARQNQDRRKAAVWAGLAALAQLAIAVALMQQPLGAMDMPGWSTYGGEPFLRSDLGPWVPWMHWLYAPAYLLLLPAIAYLHVMHRLVRPSGAVLGTLTGTAAVLLGVGQPAMPMGLACLFALGMWWWTIGKLWTQEPVLPATLGAVTAVLGAIALLLAVGLPLLLPPMMAVYPFWPVIHGVIAIWAAALAYVLWQLPGGALPGGQSPA